MLTQAPSFSVYMFISGAEVFFLWFKIIARLGFFTFNCFKRAELTFYLLRNITSPTLT